MNLSPHFTLDEMVRSAYAARRNIDNTPDEAAVAALRLLCENVLEPLRTLAHAPVHVSSGFRCETLNTAIGGASTSQHMRGEAADIEVDTWTTLGLARFIAESSLPFDQLICEFYEPGKPASGWVHVSHAVSGNQRRQVLTAHREAGRVVYTSGLLA